MVTETDWYNWQIQDFLPYLDIVFDCFGIQRIMIGSDWPVCTLGGGYSEILNIVINYIKSFSQEKQNMVLGENALDIYKILVE